MNNCIKPNKCINKKNTDERQTIQITTTTTKIVLYNIHVLEVFLNVICKYI